MGIFVYWCCTVRVLVETILDTRGLKENGRVACVKDRRESVIQKGNDKEKGFGARTQPRDSPR